MVLQVATKIYNSKPSSLWSNWVHVQLRVVTVLYRNVVLLLTFYDDLNENVLKLPISCVNAMSYCCIL